MSVQKSPLVHYEIRYEAARRQSGVSHESIMVQTRYGHTHLIVVGPEAGPPVLLLHSEGAHALEWESQLAALAEAGYRACAPDRLGHAGQSAASHIPAVRGAHAQWLEDICVELELSHPALVGAGTGAQAVLKAAATAPNPFKRLVLIGANGLMKTRPQGHHRWWSWFTQPRSLFQALKTLDARELAQVTQPTLLLIGEQDTTINPEHALKLAREKLPGLVAAETIAQADHAPHQNQPDKVNERLIAFLSMTV